MTCHIYYKFITIYYKFDGALNIQYMNIWHVKFIKYINQLRGNEFHGALMTISCNDDGSDNDDDDDHSEYDDGDYDVRLKPAAL